MTRILIIEDDSSINKILSYTLNKEGYHTDSLYDGKGAVKQVLDNKYDLVLVDWMLPFKSGVDIIKECRSNDYSNPMILLTAKSGQNDIIEGLDAGADDYLVKPFTNEILVARIKAHLRRHYKSFMENLKYGNVEIDKKSREVLVDNQVINLTKVEFDILKKFISTPETVISRDELLKEIWGFEYDGDTRLVDVHVFKLKTKLSASNLVFKSIRGVGYRLIKNEE